MSTEDGMILCLDVGNSHIFGGVFDQGSIRLRFRYASQSALTSDAFGVFLRGVIRENGVNPDEIKQIVISSVVPHLDYSIRSACKKYFSIMPFELSVTAKLPFKICYQTQSTLGADRIANAIGAIQRFPGKPIIIASFGTATTLCTIDEAGQYLGGAILPGFRLSRDSLASQTAKLPPVEIVRPIDAIGKTTDGCIQAGLYFSQLGAVKEIVAQMKMLFSAEPVVIATGGFSHLFSEEPIFSALLPDLILEGLCAALTYQHVDQPALAMV